MSAGLQSTLPNLLTFCATFELGSFSEAARKLGVTPQAASRSVARLEETLGVPLFRRTTRTVTPTDEARAYYQTARQVLALLSQAERDVSRLLLGEAAAVGLLGGVSGVVLARLAGWGVDLLSRTVLPEFPFKPDSYFWFSPQLVLILLGFSLLVCLLGAALPWAGATDQATFSPRPFGRLVVVTTSKRPAGGEPRERAPEPGEATLTVMPLRPVAGQAAGGRGAPGHRAEHQLAPPAAAPRRADHRPRQRGRGLPAAPIGVAAARAAAHR